MSFKEVEQNYEEEMNGQNPDCSECTFHNNEGAKICEMCNTPLQMLKQQQNNNTDITNAKRKKNNKKDNDSQMSEEGQNQEEEMKEDKFAKFKRKNIVNDDMDSSDNEDEPIAKKNKQNNKRKLQNKPVKKAKMDKDQQISGDDQERNSDGDIVSKDQQTSKRGDVTMVVQKKAPQKKEKKEKALPSFNPDDLKVMTTDQIEAMEKAKDEVNKKTMAQLKELCRINGEKTGGKKEDLVLRIALSSVIGMPKDKCPKCVKGKLNLNLPKQKWICKGYFDDDTKTYKFCAYKIDFKDVELVEWVWEKKNEETGQKDDWW